MEDDAILALFMLPWNEFTSLPGISVHFWMLRKRSLSSVLCISLPEIKQGESLTELAQQIPAQKPNQEQEH